MIIRSLFRGCGSYLPLRVVANEELSKSVDTSDAWIRQRTGIRERCIAAEGETTADIATIAARRALSDAGVDASWIDLVILATTTPNHTFPSTAVEVQANLGIRQGAAFDIQAVCSGFIYALATADAHLRSGSFHCALVIGAETFSRLLDWQDRSTCVLFGDGGGAFVLEAVELPGTRNDPGLLATKLRADGRYRDKLYVNGGPSTTQTVGHVCMQGGDVFKHAVILLSDIVEETLHESGFTIEEIDWFVPHQANYRIIDAMIRKLSLSREKVIMTLSQHANTSAASIPLALCVARDEGKFKSGDLILMEAMGAGFTWGAALLRW